MRKFFILILIILVSCNKDTFEQLEYTAPQMIFETFNTTLQDGQDIYFNVDSSEEHILTISNEGSVISKEVFTPTEGLNKRKIYTRSLPKGLLELTLSNSTKEVNTNIIIE